MSVDRRGRTVAAIVGIIACAIAAIIVTAIIVVPAGGDDPGAAAVETPLPTLTPMLLDLDEVSRLVGSRLTVTEERNSLGQPAGPDYAVSPAACTSVALYAQAVTYRNVAWELARRALYKSLTATVSQSVVLTASPDLAASFLNEQGKAWQRCMGVTYRFGTYSAAENRVVSYDDDIRSDRIFAVTKLVTSDIADCGHVMAVKGAYVVEAITCGGPRYDTNALADAILARIPD